MARKMAPVPVRRCGFVIGNAPCGLGAVAEYDATRGTVPICMEHVRSVVQSWPAAPIHWPHEAQARAAHGGDADARP